MSGRNEVPDPWAALPGGSREEPPAQTYAPVHVLEAAIWGAVSAFGLWMLAWTWDADFLLRQRAINGELLGIAVAGTAAGLAIRRVRRGGWWGWAVLRAGAAPVVAVWLIVAASGFMA